MTILAVETSCDETSAAVVRYRNGSFEVFSNVVSSQTKIHRKYGGVVPEVAARKQVELIIPVIEEALIQSASRLHEQVHAQRSRIRSWVLGIKDINPLIRNTKYIIRHLDSLAVTIGPGLMIALSVGVETARTLAAVWKKPIVAVNHLEGHLYSALLPEPSKIQDTPHQKQSFGTGQARYKIQTNPKFQIPSSKFLSFPAIGLIVSGGHTELVLVKDCLKYKLLGRTRDDAAGEAYDKVAKLLGLGYPGGPIIDKLAKHGNPHAFNFPRGMIKSGDYDFSFAGLKTAVLYTLQRLNGRTYERKNKNQKKYTQSPLNSKFQIPDSTLKDICASFQSAVVDVLVAKTIYAAQEYKAKSILLGGGVAANSLLKEQLSEKCKGEGPFAPTVLMPDLAYTTDNAAMIAAAAAFHAERKRFTHWSRLKADPNLDLS